MGAVVPVKPALFLIAAFSRYPAALDAAKDLCVQKWGPVAFESDRFDFRETTYYDRSMGSDQRKTFFVFEQLMDPGELAARKLSTNELENTLAPKFDSEFARPVNLDPGYLTESKLLLASTKNHAHRVYLSEGIYAEITLRYRSGAWQPWEWTYPDYCRPDFHAFFVRCRNFLRQRTISA